MAVAQLKNLQRRLLLLSDEAEQGLNRACGHELWKTVGPDAIDGLEIRPGEQRQIIGMANGMLCVSCRRPSANG